MGALLKKTRQPRALLCCLGSNDKCLICTRQENLSTMVWYNYIFCSLRWLLDESARILPRSILYVFWALSITLLLKRDSEANGTWKSNLICKQDTGVTGPFKRYFISNLDAYQEPPKQKCPFNPHLLESDFSHFPKWIRVCCSILMAFSTCLERALCIKIHLVLWEHFESGNVFFVFWRSRWSE